MHRHAPRPSAGTWPWYWKPIAAVLAVALVALIVLLTAGCTAGGQSSPVATATAPAAGEAASTAPPASPTASASPAAPLTKRQAAAAYVRIVDPANRLIDAANSDVTDRVPLAQFRADLRAIIAALRKQTAQLAAIRWPRKVQPYVAAMVGTVFPANIACDKAILRAGSYGRAVTVNLTNQDCTAASDSALPDTIRQRLGLPPI